MKLDVFNTIIIYMYLYGVDMLSFGLCVTIVSLIQKVQQRKLRKNPRADMWREERIKNVDSLCRKHSIDMKNLSHPPRASPRNVAQQQSQYTNLPTPNYYDYDQTHTIMDWLQHAIKTSNKKKNIPSPSNSTPDTTDPDTSTSIQSTINRIIRMYRDCKSTLDSNRLQSSYACPQMNQLVKMIEDAIASGSTSQASRNILLTGPPGSGKTEMAKWAANKLGLHLFIIRASHLVHYEAGEGNKCFEALFQMISMCVPCIMFFDEMEALLPSRTGNQVAQAIQAEVASRLEYLNGDAYPMNGLIIIGATNYSELLDEAVYSRFVHQLKVDAPDTNKGSAILQHLLTQTQFIVSIDSPFISTCIPLLRSDIRQTRATCETLINALLDTVEKEMQKLGPEADESMLHELTT
jgi:DNA replication protein DnaC